MKIPTRLLWAASAISILVLLISCVDTIQSNNSYILRLKNRGIVPLSTENPYIAANALINKEMERSPELKGFIDHSGAPTAIRVEQGFISPLYIEFYYSARADYYTAEENNGIWLINGPYQIDKNTLEEINKVVIIDSSNKSKIELPKPSATVPGPRFPTPLPASELTPVAVLPITPAIIPAVPTPQKTSLEPVIPITQAGGSIQSLVSRFGNSQAEVTPKGDVVHYVSNPGETLAMLSRWYTFDAGNQERLMRINHITGKQALGIGDSIVIPSYLVRNKNILSQEALSALETAVSNGSIK